MLIMTAASLCLGFIKLYSSHLPVLVYSTTSEVILIILELLHWGNLSSKCPCFEVLKVPAFVVFKIVSIKGFTGNIGCSPALVNI